MATPTAKPQASNQDPAATTTTTTTATTSTTASPPADPWTADQELALLKALVQFKPVGLHAHFRMLSIHASLLASGTCSADDAHTRIPGIWAKLRGLYDLPRLDEREDAAILARRKSSPSSPSAAAAASADEDEDDEERERAAAEAVWRDFELPRDSGMGMDFEGMMWERRLAPEGTPASGGDEDEEEWGAVAAGGTRASARRRRESTVVGTDEPRSSPVPASARGTRSGGRRGGRVARLREEAEGSVSESSGGRGSRRESKAASEAGVKDEDGDDVMEDAEDEDGEESATAEEEGDGESDSPEEDGKRAGPAKRGRGGRRGRGRRGRRRG